MTATLSAEFFATGTCRALFFGPHDHRADAAGNTNRARAPTASSCSDFETSPELQDKFAARFPDTGARNDLSAWHAFAREHPDMFASMYQLWLRKPRHVCRSKDPAA